MSGYRHRKRFNPDIANMIIAAAVLIMIAVLYSVAGDPGSQAADNVDWVEIQRESARRAK